MIGAAEGTENARSDVWLRQVMCAVGTMYCRRRGSVGVRAGGGDLERGIRGGRCVR